MLAGRNVRSTYDNLGVCAAARHHSHTLLRSSLLPQTKCSTIQSHKVKHSTGHTLKMLTTEYHLPLNSKSNANRKGGFVYTRRHASDAKSIQKSHRLSLTTETKSRNSHLSRNPLSTFAYDPSAGSPTETLLRLLLPLSAPVRVSLCRTPSLATSVRQSKHLTGTLNR